MPTTDEIKAFVRANIGTVHLVSQVSEHFGEPVHALRKSFLRAEGRPISAFIHEERLEHLAKSLTETDLPITEACTAAGYARSDSAARAFRKHFGVSMRDYRQGRRAV